MNEARLKWLGRGCAALVALLLLAWGLAWTNGVDSAVRPTSPISVPKDPRPEETSPRAAAEVQAGAQARLAQAAREDSQYTADQAAVASDQASRRTLFAGLAAALTGLAALGALAVSWQRLHEQRREASQREQREKTALEQAEAAAKEDRRRADRLHLTELFNSAAVHLGGDESAQTAGVFVLERLFNDASYLLTDDSEREQRDSLQRAVIETLAGFVRRHSVEHSGAWHRDLDPPHDPTTGLHHSYRSPPSIRAAIAVLGRLRTDLHELDLTAAHLAGIELRGVYRGLRLTAGRLRGITIIATDLIAGAVFDEAIIETMLISATNITGSLIFTGATLRGSVQYLPLEGQDNIHAMLSLENAAIEGVVDFAQIGTSAILRGATVRVGGALSVIGAGMDVDLRRAKLSGDVYLSDITGRVQLDAARVDGHIDLSSARAAMVTTTDLGYSSSQAGTFVVGVDDDELRGTLEGLGFAVKD